MVMHLDNQPEILSNDSGYLSICKFKEQENPVPYTRSTCHVLLLIHIQKSKTKQNKDKTCAISHLSMSRRLKPARELALVGSIVSLFQLAA